MPGKEHALLNYFLDSLEKLKAEQQEAYMDGGHKEAAKFEKAIFNTLTEFSYIKTFFAETSKGIYALKPKTSTPLLKKLLDKTCWYYRCRRY